MRGSARFCCAAALSYIVFASFLMAQQQQWKVQFTWQGNGDREVQTNMWNAGRMTMHNQEFNRDGSPYRDQTFNFAFNEVELDDPDQLISEGKLLAWQVAVRCRKGSENGGKCINMTVNPNNRDGSEAGATDFEIIWFNTKEDAVAFVSFFRK